MGVSLDKNGVTLSLVFDLYDLDFICLTVLIIFYQI
jgi:hypothetical protein